MDIPPMDIDFLQEPNKSQFNSSFKQVFENAYKTVLDSVKDPADLPYIPKLYAFPFLLIKIVGLNGKQSIKLTYTAQTSVDPSDVQKLAIFIVTYLSARSYEEIGGCLAHELAHFIFLKGQVDIDPTLIMAQIQGGYLQMRQVQENGEATCREKFREPVCQWLLENDRKMRTGEIVKAIRNNAETMNYSNFLKVTLGTKYEEVINKQVEKLKKI